jgi:hypothetical protein
MRDVAREVVLAHRGNLDCLIKVTENRNAPRPAYRVFVKEHGAKRGRCIANIITHRRTP